MKLGLKVKLAATTMALAGMFSSVSAASAEVMTGIGVKSIPAWRAPIVNVAEATKTTSDQCSYVELGDVTIYGSVQLMTRSQDGANGIVDSTPWTLSDENSSIYLGQYISLNTYKGQKIWLKAKTISSAVESYTADFESWDYR